MGNGSIGAVVNVNKRKKKKKNSNKVFSNRIKMAMEFSNIKQIDLAKETNISRALINKYVKGQATPKKDNLIAISKVLNVNEGWLMGYDDIMKPKSETIEHTIKKYEDEIILNISDILKLLNRALENSNLTLDEKDLLLAPVKYLYKKSNENLK